MTRIGLVTICDYSNYGNRLQNYAVQEVLKSLGCEVTTLVNVPPSSEQSSSTSHVDRLRIVLSMSKMDVLYKTINRLKAIAFRTSRSEVLQRRISAFKSWTSEHIRETAFTLRQGDIPRGLTEQFDFFVVGSDQVWNPLFRIGFDVDFLSFAPPYKRIAYAPSFGISEIPQEYEKTYREWLSDIGYISVRETSGASIIKSLTGRDAPVLIDPTQMLTGEEWEKITTPAAKPDRDYMLTYFLGYTPSERRAFIRSIARKSKLEIVSLATLNDPVRFVADPSEFLDYIQSASLILTDSFHGTIFSILFNRPFVVFDRMSPGLDMSSRIETLLSLLRLEHRKFDRLQEHEIFEVDYSRVDGILERERQKALVFLQNALRVRQKT